MTIVPAKILLPPRSLQRRLFVLLAAMGLGALLITVLIWLPAAIDDIHNSQRELRQVSVRFIRDQIRLQLSMDEEDLRSAAQRFRAALMEKDREALRLTAQRFLQNNSAFEEVGILDEQGQELLRLSRKVVITDQELADRSTSSLFREGMQQEIHWEPVTFTATSEPLLSLSIHFPGLSSSFQGLVFGVINLRPLWKLADEFKISYEGRAYVVDEAGRLIAAADPSVVLQRLSFLDRPFIRDLIDFTRLTDRFFLEGDYVNESGVRTAATGLLLPRPRWGIVVEQPRAALIAPIVKKIWFSGAFLFLGLLLSFALAQILSRRFTKPIIRLKEGAQQIGEGNLAYRVPVHGNDEIGALARQFNHMADQIHSAQETTLAALTIPVMSHTGEVQEVLGGVLAKVMLVTGTEAASIRLTDDEQTEFTSSVYQGLSEAHQRAWPRFLREGSRRKRVLTTGKPLFIEDMRNDSGAYLALLAEAGFQSAVYLPLKTPQKTFGLLFLTSRKPRQFRSQETDIMQAIAHQISVALQNIQLFQEAMTTAAELTDINRAMKIEINARQQAEEEKRIFAERLHRAEKMEALGTLAGGVAHDLNNVLGVLMGYSELLVEKLPEGNPLKPYAASILQSSEKAAAIIQDLLTLARRGVVVAKVVDMNSLIANLLATPEFDRVKDYHPQVKITTDLGQDLLNIKGSPVHLEKTVLNLLSNAAEAISGPGEVTIRTENRYLDQAVRGYETVEEGEYVVVTVADTGHGIAAADLNKIFEPFYTRKSMGRSGTGLGLAIVWGTVQDHAGYIDVQSSEGKGSCFTLYFPVTREKISETLQKIPMSEYLGQGESVLVVDDVAEQRQVATTLLTSLGYQVSSVASGEAAVAYLTEHQADILVLDMIMTPGIDGLETYQRILTVKPQQKAIIVSGFSESERAREAQKLGAGVYVKKPYLKEKIGVAIRDELTRK